MLSTSSVASHQEEKACTQSANWVRRLLYQSQEVLVTDWSAFGEE